MKRVWKTAHNAVLDQKLIIFIFCPVPEGLCGSGANPAQTRRKPGETRRKPGANPAPGARCGDDLVIVAKVAVPCFVSEKVRDMYIDVLYNG